LLKSARRDLSNDTGRYADIGTPAVAARFLHLHARTFAPVLLGRPIGEVARQHTKITKKRSEKFPRKPEVIELFKQLDGAGPLPLHLGVA
jgi:hypothetical protein